MLQGHEYTCTVLEKYGQGCPLLRKTSVRVLQDEATVDSFEDFEQTTSVIIIWKNDR